MNIDRLRRYCEAWLLRAETARSGGPALDPATEAASALQAIGEILGDVETNTLARSLLPDEE